MAKVTARASSILYGSADGTEDPFDAWLDDDVNAYEISKVYGTGTSTRVFDFKNRFNIPTEATVKRIQMFAKVRTAESVTFSARLIKDATSTSSYTDLGDGSVKIATQEKLSENYHSASFQVAATSLSPDFINSGKMQLRSYFKGHKSSGLSSTNIYLYDMYMEIEYEAPKHTLTVKAGTGGTVTGGGEYESGTSVTLTATPNTGYKFKQWSDGNTSATRTVTVAGNATYTAQFEKTTCTVTTAASPADGGTVTGGGTYESGTSVTLTAEPTIDGANSKVFQFKQWSDGDKSNPRTVTVTGDATYTAEFEQLYFCSAGASPNEGGTVAVTGDGWYPTGTSVTFKATANEGYKFVKWSNGDTSETLTVTVGTSNALYLAYFEKEATSNTFRGTSRQTVYRGTKKQAVYRGTTKIS